MALVHLVIGVDLTYSWGPSGWSYPIILTNLSYKFRVNRVTDDSSADNNCKLLDFIVSDIRINL